MCYIHLTLGISPFFNKNAKSEIFDKKTANVLFGTHILLKHETKKRTQNKIERKQNKRKEKNRKEKKREKGRKQNILIKLKLKL